MQKRTVLFAGGTFAAVFFALVVTQYSHSMVYAYENVMFRVMPSAERAYTYGSKHFDAMHSDEYDLDRAEYFFDRAHALNPNLPYVQHQRARIAFLRSDFSRALRLINAELALPSEQVTPSSYYVRGLIEGYMGEYAAAAKDYETYLRSDPTNWAAANDLAWVLLKDNKPQEALAAIETVLPLWPENPWLLNSKATALFEIGRVEEARDAAALAVNAVARVTEAEWSRAYPGNDPLIAREGVAAFREAVAANMHTLDGLVAKRVE